MSTILQAHPDIDVVLGADTVVLGALAALEAAGKARPDQFLGGIDGEPEAVAEIKKATAPTRQASAWRRRSSATPWGSTPPTGSRARASRRRWTSCRARSPATTSRSTRPTSPIRRGLRGSGAPRRLPQDVWQHLLRHARPVCEFPLVVRDEVAPTILLRVRPAGFSSRWNRPVRSHEADRGMTTDECATERPGDGDAARLARIASAGHQGARRGFRPRRAGAGRGRPDRPLLAAQRLVLPAREFRRHRRQLDVDPDRGARHVGAADRRLCRSLHRQHDGADRHHRREGRGGDPGPAACRRRRAGARLPAWSAERPAGAQAQHFAAHRDAGDAGALRRARLRRQQHRGLWLPRSAARTRPRQDPRRPVFRDHRASRFSSSARSC